MEVNSNLPWHVKHPATDQELRPGLTFHFGDQIDGQSRLWSGKVHDRFRLILVLQGCLDISFGDKRLLLGGETGVNMSLVSLQASERFTRRAVRGNYCRRISIGVSEEWLYQSSACSELSTSVLKWRHLDTVSWQSDTNTLKLAEEMISAELDCSALQGLYRESRAIALLLEGLAQKASLLSTSHPVPKKWLDFRHWLQSNACSNLSVEVLAKKMNTTPSTLQRNFKRHFNETLFECIQSVRLETGMRRLMTSRDSVTKIAMEVGYGSSASFCTAFKRYFGMTPKKARNQ